jgi:hypothetical protein
MEKETPKFQSCGFGWKHIWGGEGTLGKKMHFF